MDKKIRELLNILETTPSPDGMKARVLDSLQPSISSLKLNRFQRLLFASPVRAAAILSVAVSGLLWAIFGSNYPTLLMSLFSVR